MNVPRPIKSQRPGHTGKGKEKCRKDGDAAKETDVPKCLRKRFVLFPSSEPGRESRKNSAEPKKEQVKHQGCSQTLCSPPGGEVNGLPPPKAKPAYPGSLPSAQDATGGDGLLPPPPLWTSRGKAAFLTATPPHLPQSIEPLYGPAGY